MFPDRLSEEVAWREATGLPSLTRLTAGYKAYIAERQGLSKYGGRFLTRGGKSETPEGRTRSRAVVIEFPTYAAAVECYRSPEFSKAMALRQGKSFMDLAGGEGYDGSQPTDM